MTTIAIQNDSDMKMKPALSLDTEEGLKARTELERRLEMGDYAQDFYDWELDFIASWPGEKGNGTFYSSKIVGAYDLFLSDPSDSSQPMPGTKPGEEYTWPMLAAELRQQTATWEAERPRGKVGHALRSLGTAIDECLEAGMDDDQIAEGVEDATLNHAS